MAFLTKGDFDASVHEEILNALTRGNDKVIDDNIDRTIDEMKAFLNGRYDTKTDFGKVGDERNKFLVRIATTITKYYIFLVHNPRKLTQALVDEYEKAWEMLNLMQAGKLKPKGLTPLKPDTSKDDTNGNSSSGNGTTCSPCTLWGSDTALDSIW